MGYPRPLFHLFLSFLTINTILQQIIWKMSIQNTMLGFEPRTTRPGLPPFNLFINSPNNFLLQIFYPWTKLHSERWGMHAFHDKNARILHIKYCSLYCRFCHLLIIKDWSGPTYVLKNVFMISPKISVLEFGYECVYRAFSTYR